MPNFDPSSHTCDWCLNDAKVGKRLWGNDDSGIYWWACKNHEHLLDKMEPKKPKNVTTKSRLRQRDVT